MLRGTILAHKELDATQPHWVQKVLRYRDQEEGGSILAFCFSSGI